MAVFEIILAFLLIGVLVSLLAPKLGVPAPALLALVGATAAFAPGMPTITLDPELALALFIAPILFSAGYATSPRDLKRSWVHVGGLVVFAVGLTTAGVAVVAHSLLPAMPWTVAIALGAIVAPPDAAAANAVLSKVRLPHRMMVILEGESLLNDATSLLLYRLAVGAVIGGITIWTLPSLILSVLGGVVFGVVLGHLYVRTTAQLKENMARIVLPIVGCIAIWLIAETIEISAVLAVVSFAMTIKRFARNRINARERRNTYAVWELFIFVLNVLAFALIGFQLPGIFERLDHPFYAGLFALAIFATVILARFVWVFTHANILRFISKSQEQRIPLGQTGLIAWCGLRGIVTLAAALALPLAFPHRDLIVFAAFVTVLGTLLLQGFTLGPLLKRLNINADRTIEQESVLVKAKTAQAVLTELDGQWTGPGGYLVRQDYRARLQDEEASEVSAVVALRRKAFLIERRILTQMLHQGQIGDACFHHIEETLDWTEAETTEVCSANMAVSQPPARENSPSTTQLPARTGFGRILARKTQ